MPLFHTSEIACEHFPSLFFSLPSLTRGRFDSSLCLCLCLPVLQVLPVLPLLPLLSLLPVLTGFRVQGLGSGFGEPKRGRVVFAV